MDPNPDTIAAGPGTRIDVKALDPPGLAALVGGRVEVMTEGEGVEETDVEPVQAAVRRTTQPIIRAGTRVMDMVRTPCLIETCSLDRTEPQCQEFHKTATLVSVSGALLAIRRTRVSPGALTARSRRATIRPCAVSFARISLAVLIFAIASCSHTPDSGVKGSLTYFGGPAVLDGPGTPGVYHRESGELVVYSEDGAEAGRVSFAEGDGFSVALDPGTHRLVASSGDAQYANQKVTVASHEFVSVEIKCSIV
jgi:hypothetical protein